MSEFLKILNSYLIISKPRLVGLLYFTGLCSCLISSSLYGFDLKNILLVSAAIILAVMGSNAATAYIDRKMDKVMSRTSHRPVPAEIIKPAICALIFGLVLVAAGVAVSAMINTVTAVFVLFGFLDSAVIYNAASKKRSQLNIVFGAPAGGMPILAGWTAASGGKINLLPVILFLLVMLWTPMHIWSLAYFYKDDYRKAGVPMLPVLLSDRKFFILLLFLNFGLVFLSVFTGFYFNLGWVYLVLSSLLGAAIMVFSLILLIKNKSRYAWILFKFSSPYLAMIFLIITLKYLFFQ